MDPRDEWKNEDTESLCGALLAMDSIDEMSRLLRDLCSFNELTELAQRWAIVRRLEQGMPYRRIAEDLGVSTATITRVNQWLQHGMGGYRLALERRQ